MRTEINASVAAGSVVRRVREDRGISRSELAKRANISPRTLFAFEQGQNENIGLSAFLRLLSALDLALSIDDGAVSNQDLAASSATDVASQQLFQPAWDKLGDMWRLDGKGL